MAIYHLHAKVVQRSKGENVIAASAYRRAAKLRDHQEEKAFDFTAKKDVIYSDLMVPDNAPAWVKALAVLQTENPSEAAEQLWNALEAVEKRKDAQLGREIEFALPIELNEAQSIPLAREFIKDQLVSRGMIADWSVHWDTGNPHVHVLLTMRVLTEAGFGRRAIEWNQKALLQTWREQWAEYANYHLHLHQHNVRIDHRSYEAQGIDLIPGIHQGGGARAKASRGETMDRIEEDHAIRRLNLARLSENAEIFFRQLSSLGDTFTDTEVANLLGRYVDARMGSFSQPQNPIGSDTPKTQTPLEAALENTAALTPDVIERILNLISTHESVFTEKDIAKAVKHLTEQADDFAKVVTAIKQSPQVIALGRGEDNRERFTTRALFDVENTIQQLADELKCRWHRHIPEPKKQAILAQHQTQTGKTLTDEQKTAIDHILKPHAIACIVGRAGTGKSFCLGAAKSLWESQNVSVYGIALSGIAADGLSKDTGLPSTTIASFCYRVENQLLTLKPHDVLVMDEAGMTDSLSMLSVLKIVHQAKAKLVLVGDPAQLQSVGPGASFRALVERLGFAEMQTVYRQSVPWQRQATVDFSNGAMAKGLAAYKAQNGIHVEATPETAMQKLLKAWQKICSDASHLNQVLVIAHRNEDVQALNALLRADRVQAGKIETGYLVKNRQGEINLAAGDRLLFLKNDRELGVSNGRFATVESIDFMSTHKVLSFSVTLDGSHQKVTIHPAVYANFTYGYAATVHKTQGMTVDHSLVYVGGKGWNRHLTYVALSRHRQSCQVYADRETHANQGILMRRLSRLGLKDSVLDFPLAFAERRGIDHQSISQKLSTHLAERLAKWKKQLVDKIAQWRVTDKTLAQEAVHARESLKPEKVDQQQIKKQQESASDQKNEKKSPRNQPTSSYQRMDMKRLRAALNDRAEDVATHYLGQPKLKQGHTLRYGRNKGSLVVTIQGAKQGLWRDFQWDKGGDMFSLIQHALETKDFKTVLIEATRFLGGDSVYRISESETVKASILSSKNTDLDAYTQQKIQKAQAIYRETQPIVGTLAERYLREHRGILQPLDDHTFRYHPHLKNWMTGTTHPALVVLARDDKNQVCGLQAIFLDAKTAKKATDLGSQVKLSRGFIGEGAMVHRGNPHGRIALAEGPETALSIAEAQPDWTVYVTFGVLNVAKVRLPYGTKSVFICADNDGLDSVTKKSIAKSAERLSQRGFDVWLAEPQKPLDKAKWDFNDVLLTERIAQVQGDLAQATLVGKGIVKEHNSHAVEKNRVGFNTGIPASETTSTQTISTSTPDIQNASLQTLLMQYVDRELEQTRLVNAMHSARLKDPNAGKIAASEALAHASTLEAFAEEVLQHREIQQLLETKQNVKPPHLAESGGFSKIRERLQQGEWSEENIHLLAIQLRSKSAGKVCSQMKERNRDGRSR